MQKTVIVIFWMIVLLFSTIAYAGYVYPTFDSDTDPWLYRETIPIIIDEGTILGLTNPNIGTTFYGYLFDVVEGDVEFAFHTFENNSDYSYTTFYHSDFKVAGTHEGPGNPLSDIIIGGSGLVNVYEQDYSVPYYSHEYAGSFTVVPEPITSVLLSVGFLGVFLRRKNG